MKPSAIIKQSPDDFRVEEIPAYEPSGEGTHVFLTVEKRDTSTSWCARAIARQLDISPREIGHAGMKDRRAVTVQRLSVPYEPDAPLDPLLTLEGDGWRVLDAVRHEHKLRVGHLRGNRFQIVLRGLPHEHASQAAETLAALQKTGFPNAYGPQRFGRDGDNPQRALAWLRGEQKPPRDKRERRLLFSSVQSMLFDQVLARRVEEGTWDTVLLGDLAKTHERGGLFICEDPDTDARRAAQWDISPTGPMFGPKMRWPEGAPAELEKDILEQALGTRQVPRWLGKLGAGTRRVLRVKPEHLEIQIDIDNMHPESQSLTLSFVLPKGAYATTFVLQAVDLRQPTFPAASSD